MPETTDSNKSTERFQLSAEVARVVARDADPAYQMRVARGKALLSDVEQVQALFLLCLRGSEPLKEAARQTLLQSSNNALRGVLESPMQHPRLLDFIARVRIDDLGTLILLRRNPVVLNSTWVYVFGHCNYEILTHFCDGSFATAFPAEVRAAVLSNSQASQDLRAQVERTLDDEAQKNGVPQSGAPAADGDTENRWPENGIDDDEVPDDGYEETKNISKQQMVLELGMAEKVKMAMTGDKEWRSILIKDSNKTVSSAVMRNPRITEGEVLFMAQNRSTSDDIIREILLNREWLKNYAIRHALVEHPRTPLVKALRFLSTMNEKDIRMLAKSRNVSSAIVNTCRRMLVAKQKK